MKQGSFDYCKGMGVVKDQEGQLWGCYYDGKPFKVERKTRIVEEVYYESTSEVK
jgi:hypothetical protein